MQEEADRRNKSLDEMVGELVMIGLHKQKKSLLDELMEEGKQKAIEQFGYVPSEEEVIEIVHARHKV